ncbi:MAG: BatD family protein [Thiohalomonadales bacterium]
MLRSLVILMLYYFLLLIVVTKPVFAGQTNSLKIKTWIEPKENIIAKQQINLYIEIVSDKRITGGTHISSFEVNDAIVLQRDTFTVNSTRTEAGKTWNTRMWTIVIYPQRDGIFEIPEIPIQMTLLVKEPNVTKSSEIKSKPITFNTRIPEELQDNENWIATSRFNIKQNLNKSIDKLKPGDALIRTISLSADNLPAMMLPAISVEKIPGVAIYQKPFQIQDTANRGVYLAQRTEEITYVFEKIGNFILPAQTFYWWNTETQLLETIELAEYKLLIKLAPAGSGEKNTDLSLAETGNFNDLFRIAKIITGIFFIVLLLFLLILKIRKIVQKRKQLQPTLLSEMEIHRRFKTACQKNNSQQAIKLFYLWLDNYSGSNYHGSIRKQLRQFKQQQLNTSFNDIMRSIYFVKKNSAADLEKFSDQFIKTLKKTNRVSWHQKWKIGLKLN